MLRASACLPLFAPVLLVAVLFAPASGQSVCPSTIVTVGGSSGATTITTTAAEMDTSRDGGSASFNLTDGRFVVGSWSAGIGRITAQDTYTIDQLPAGTPVTLVARLRLNGVADASSGLQRWAEYAGRLRHGTEMQSAGVYVSALFSPLPHTRYLNTTIELSLPVTAGVPFTLETRVVAACEFGARADSQSPALLTFAGLPPGARLTSCQGYLQESPVAVEPTSWSRIKVRASGGSSGP